MDWDTKVSGKGLSNSTSTLFRLAFSTTEQLSCVSVFRGSSGRQQRLNCAKSPALVNRDGNRHQENTLLFSRNVTLGLTLLLKGSEIEEHRAL